MRTKAEITDHSGYTDTHSGFVIPSPRIKGERIRIYPDSRLRGFVIRHSDFACRAAVRQLPDEGGVIIRTSVISVSSVVLSLLFVLIRG
jgi:hypothetical protein